MGVIPYRDNDTFGVGYYRIETTDGLPEVLDRVMGNGQGFEMFYNIELTPWLHITPTSRSSTRV